MPQQINVGLIGYKFMGKAHTSLPMPFYFPDVKLVLVMKVICGRDERASARLRGSSAGEKNSTTASSSSVRTSALLISRRATSTPRWPLPPPRLAS